MNQYKTETIEHLGLVSSMIDELGIVEVIDNAIESNYSFKIEPYYQ